jgi:hypothetical protein
MNLCNEGVSFHIFDKISLCTGACVKPIYGKAFSVIRKTLTNSLI